MNARRGKLIALGLVVWGLSAFAPGLMSTVAVQSQARAPEVKTIMVDVALDCRTWRFNQGISDPDFGRGDGFIANGKIFPVFTLHPGEQTNDPNDPGSIGTFIENGTMAATLLEIIDGKRPAFVGTWYHLLNDGRGLVAAGPHPDSGPMAVIGGMGRFSGASGDLDVEILGDNITGCPNMRLTFNLKNLAPK